MLQHVPVEARECMFDAEGNLWKNDNTTSAKTILAKYSQEGCQFECVFGQVLASEELDHNCIPWYFQPIVGMYGCSFIDPLLQGES